MAGEQMGKRCLERDCQRDGQHLLALGADAIYVSPLDTRAAGHVARSAQALGVLCDAHAAEVERWASGPGREGAWCFTTELSPTGRARSFIEWREGR